MVCESLVESLSLKTNFTGYFPKREKPKDGKEE